MNGHTIGFKIEIRKLAFSPSICWSGFILFNPKLNELVNCIGGNVWGTKILGNVNCFEMARS